MIVATQYRLKHLEQQFNIHVDCKLFSRDVEVDQSLTWSVHVDKIDKKISGRIEVLKRVRHLVPNHILITM